MNSAQDFPKGATHTADFYGQTHYYQRVDYQHLNQVSEEWQTLTKWNVWDQGSWVGVGKGFSARRLQALDAGAPPNPKEEKGTWLDAPTSWVDPESGIEYSFKPVNLTPDDQKDILQELRNPSAVYLGLFVQRAWTPDNAQMKNLHLEIMPLLRRAFPDAHQPPTWKRATDAMSIQGEPRSLLVANLGAIPTKHTLPDSHVFQMAAEDAGTGDFLRKRVEWAKGLARIAKNQDRHPGQTNPVNPKASDSGPMNIFEALEELGKKIDANTLAMNSKSIAQRLKEALFGNTAPRSHQRREPKSLRP